MVVQHVHLPEILSNCTSWLNIQPCCDPESLLIESLVSKIADSFWLLDKEDELLLCNDEVNFFLSPFLLEADAKFAKVFLIVAPKPKFNNNFT